MAGTIRWARVVVADSDGRRQEMLLAGHRPPDLAVIDALARLRLAVRRAGGRMWLEEVSPPLAELLDLAGLRREVEGQPEGREQAFGVQE
jgi:hypothetical protein